MIPPVFFTPRPPSADRLLKRRKPLFVHRQERHNINGAFSRSTPFEVGLAQLVRPVTLLPDSVRFAQDIGYVDILYPPAPSPAHAPVTITDEFSSRDSHYCNATSTCNLVSRGCSYSEYFVLMERKKEWKGENRTIDQCPCYLTL